MPIQLQARPAGITEKRAFPRTPLHMVVHFQSGAGLHTGESVDLSAGGMLLQSPVPIAVGTTLALKFHPSSWSRPVLIDGRVVRNAGGLKKIGVEFQHVGSDLKFDLARFVQRMLERGHHPSTSQSPTPLPRASTSSSPAPTSTLAPSAAANQRPAPTIEPARTGTAHIAGSLRSNLASADRFLREYGTRIGRGTMCVDTALPLKLGAVVEVTIELPARARPAVVRGRVIKRDVSDAGASVEIELLAEPGAGLDVMREVARALKERSTAPLPTGP